MTATRRKILILNHVSEMGGAEHSLLDMLTSLDREKYEMVVVLPSPGSLGSRIEELGIRLAYLPFKRFKKTLNPVVLFEYMWNVITVARRLVKLIKRERPDILHANSNTAQIYAAIASVFVDLPLVWHSRDLVDLGVIGKCLYRASSRTIAISNAVAEHLRRYAADGEKLVVIYNGVCLRDDTAEETGDEAKGLREELGIGCDTFVAAMVGQLVPWKNHRLFFEAASLIAEKLPEMRFLVIGGDLFHDHLEYRMALEKCVEALGLRDKLTFVGHRPDIVSVLSGIDVLVHPAAREPFGRVVVEAMAMGKPVVAIDACGPAEIIKSGTDGILVPPDSPGDMARAVTTLASDRNRAESIGRAAMERATRDFAPQDFAAKLDSLYTELAWQD